MELTAEALRDQIPYYLTWEQKQGLMKALQSFPRDIQYYLNKYHDEVLQGDGWTKLVVFNFDTGERASIKGIVLSNTCDVSPENKRDLPANVLFAPIVSLNSYIELLKKSGVTDNSITSKVTAIKRQEVTTLFYLPASDNLGADHIALLDNVHTMPAKTFASEKGMAKIFTLSDVGFYLFIFKLSVHFCRLHEDVVRA